MRFRNHPTIMSWMSRSDIRINVVAYAGTIRGRDSVKRHPKVDQVSVAFPLSSGSRTWSRWEADEVTRICRKYASRTSRGGAPLGYRDAFTLTVFEHKCPNTAPAILWAGKKGSWKALFAKRPGTEFRSWPAPLSRAEYETRMLEAIGQTKLAAAEFQPHLGHFGRQRVLVLAAIAKHHRKPPLLSQIVGLSERAISVILQECVKQGWITWDNRITERGLMELKLVRRLVNPPASEVRLKDEFYFPMELRAAGVSI